MALTLRGWPGQARPWRTGPRISESLGSAGDPQPTL